MSVFIMFMAIYGHCVEQSWLQKMETVELCWYCNIAYQAYHKTIIALYIIEYNLTLPLSILPVLPCCISLNVR